MSQYLCNQAAVCGSISEGGKIKWSRENLKESESRSRNSAVVIRLDRGRNKVDIEHGVIKAAYPSVFTVLIDPEDENRPSQLLSFSYTDVITKDIRMKLC